MSNTELHYSDNPVDLKNLLIKKIKSSFFNSMKCVEILMLVFFSSLGNFGTKIGKKRFLLARTNGLLELPFL